MKIRSLEWTPHLSGRTGIPALVLTAALAGGPYAGPWLRLNQAGYRIDAPKVVVAMSETDLTGATWSLRKGDSLALSGVLGGSFAGIGDHTPKAFNHRIDLSRVTAPAEYRLEVGGVQAVVSIQRDPYTRFLLQALRHVRVERSGAQGLLVHGPSHLGDSAARVQVPDGDLANGAWKDAVPSRKLDMAGGHYDAGDYIKFTLNESYLALRLMQAWELRPDLDSLLDEADHALRWIAKAFPDDSTFVIEVGDGLDHDQGNRLPENDRLDGKRPALCALSRVHMGVAAAALARGARIAKGQGRAGQALAYQEKALALWRVATGPRSVATAFLRDPTNDFYWVKSDVPSMQWAAAELHALTGEAKYLEAFKTYRSRSDCGEVGWSCLNFDANLASAAYDAASKSRMSVEAENYEEAAKVHPWNLPGDSYYWAVLHRWVAMAAASRAGGYDAAFQGTLDYVFGRNPWGVSFLFSQNLSNSLRNLYSQIYPLSGQFPTGALSEGPGDKTTHDEMLQYFDPLPRDTLAPFNTRVAVFQDNGQDFMLQEATIGGQADAIWLLALASRDTSSSAGVRAASPTRDAWRVFRSGGRLRIQGAKPKAVVELRDLGGRRLASGVAGENGGLDWPIGTAGCLVAVSPGRPALLLAP
ncbi:MAG: glycoside hydrolase family 9 protein [Fibrobacterota bacterium]|nr:MAG: glycoside hydrolase family 9 protein [Fibrobacterota bacterium]